MVNADIEVQAIANENREYSSTMVNRYFLGDEEGKCPWKSTFSLLKGLVDSIKVPDV